MTGSAISALEPDVGDTHGQRRRVVLAAVILTWLAILVIYRDTFAEMVLVWWASDTFRHGFLIVPIAVWLIWRQRAAFGDARAAPSLSFALLVVAAAILWGLSALTNINATMQLAAMAMLVFAPLAVIGWSSGRTLLFPLAFLFFAVPLGEALVLPLMDFTGRFAVAALRATGIPVFKEGFLISTADGEFEVARACSGIRYLLATLALGSLFAYLVIERPWKRVVFIALCLLVPIVANGIRAYGIILIASLAGIDEAFDVDHLIYGWIFFGIVAFLLFMLGRRLADDVLPERAPPATPSGARTAGAPAWVFGASAAALVAVVGAAAALPAIVSGNPAPAPLARNVQPMLSGTWQGPAAVSSQWRPQYEGADRMLLGSYRQGAHIVDVALVLYDAQSQGEELVNERNQPYDSPRWIRVDEGVEVVTAGTLGPVALTRTSIRSPAGNRLVWSTYIVDGTPTRSGIRVKIESALERLLGRRSGSIAMLVSMPVEHLGQEVRGELQSFVESYLPALIACLRGADSSSSRCVE